MNGGEGGGQSLESLPTLDNLSTTIYLVIVTTRKTHTHTHTMKNYPWTMVTLKFYGNIRKGSLEYLFIFFLQNDFAGGGGIKKKRVPLPSFCHPLPSS